MNEHQKTTQGKEIVIKVQASTFCRPDVVFVLAAFEPLLHGAWLRPSVAKYKPPGDDRNHEVKLSDPRTLTSHSWIFTSTRLRRRRPQDDLDEAELER